MRNIKPLKHKMTEGLDELITKVYEGNQDRERLFGTMQLQLRILQKAGYDISIYKEIYSDMKKEYGI